MSRIIDAVILCLIGTAIGWQLHGILIEGEQSYGDFGWFGFSVSVWLLTLIDIAKED